MIKKYINFRGLNAAYEILLLGISFELIFTIFAIIYQKKWGESLLIGGVIFFIFFVVELYTFVFLIYFLIKRYKISDFLPFLLNFIGLVLIFWSVLILIISSNLGLKHYTLNYVLPISFITIFITVFGLKITSIFLCFKYLRSKNFVKLFSAFLLLVVILHILLYFYGEALLMLLLFNL